MRLSLPLCACLCLLLTLFVCKCQICFPLLAFSHTSPSLLSPLACSASLHIVKQTFCCCFCVFGVSDSGPKSFMLSPSLSLSFTLTQNFRCFLNFTNALHSNLLNNSNSRAARGAAAAEWQLQVAATINHNQSPKWQRGCSTLAYPAHSV